MQLLMSWLSKMLASLLVAVLTGAILTAVFNQTVLNSHYLEGKLAATDSYSRLSVALNDQVAKNAAKEGGEANIDPAVAAKLRTILTPNVLQQKINGGLEGLEAYYRGNGPQPTIDLTDLAAQATAAGIPVPEDSGLTKPITLSGSRKATDVSKTFNQVRVGTLITAVVLTLALLLVSWERHKWASLPDVAIVVGVLVGLVTVGAVAASQLASRFLHFNSDGEAFASIGRDLASTIAHDLAIRFGVVAAVFLAIGIGTRIWVARLAANTPVKPITPAGLKRAVKITN